MKRFLLFLLFTFFVQFIFASVPGPIEPSEIPSLMEILTQIVIAIVSFFQDFTYYTGYGEKRENIGAYLEKKPIVKFWIIFFCMAILPFIIYIMGTTNNDNTQRVLYFLSFFLLVGPVFIVSEIDRYHSLVK